MTGDTTPQRPFAVIHGGDEKSAWTEVIEDHTADYTCKTFGELFADFACQLRKGEHANLMHRLNECASEYGAVPMPEVYADQSEDDAHDVACAMHAAEAGNAGSWPTVADILRLEVLRLRGLLCSSPDVQAKDQEDGSLRSGPSARDGDSREELVEVVAEALRERPFIFGPNTRDAIVRGMDKVWLTGGERRDLARMALDAVDAVEREEP